MVGYLMINELESMWKQEVVTHFKSNPEFTLRPEENHEKTQLNVGPPEYEARMPLIHINYSICLKVPRYTMKIQ
jgi:hypothetical protein